VETSEIAEHIHGHGHHEPHPDRFRRFAAVYLGIIAMLLAIAALGGGEATKKMLSANIQAADTYAFYQAKNARQLIYETTADELELQFAAGTLPGAAADRAGALVKRYRDTAKRYESDPEKGEGKRELLAKARAWEERRDRADAQIPNFEYGEALFQIAIVLGSVAIVAASGWLIGLSAALAFAGTLFTLNGYLLLVPFGHG
jgi:hypothetical protein